MGVFVSVQFAVRTRVVSPTGKGARPDAKAGVDAGMRELATVVDGDDQVVVVQNPAPLRQTLAERRRVSRSLSRRIPGSRGHRQAKAKLARLDRRAVCLRRETYHRLTRWLVDTYGEIHVQDLDLAAMKRSMGRRAFRRAVSDTALGMFPPLLTDKATDGHAALVVVDRFFPSSQIHHGCGGRLLGEKLAKQLSCERCGAVVDRDENAAKNLRDWAGSCQSWSSWGQRPARTRATRWWYRRQVRCAGDRTPGETAQDLAQRGLGEARTNAGERQRRNPARGASA
jgi:putative transposase